MADGPGPLRASIVVIGDEILGGFVQDTNSGWLATRLRVLGVPLDRVVTVPDTPEAIDEALRAELARQRPRVVVTSGGIGSTPDDVTLAAVAATLGTGLRTDETIAAAIDRSLARSAALGIAVAPGHAASMRKMARVPEAAYLLPGAEGVAPGVVVDVDGGSARNGGATIVVLPGVPSEFRRIVAEGLEPGLLVGRGVPEHVVELRHAYPESALNPVFDRVVAEYRDVHLGSYPGRECIVRLQGPDRDRVEAAAVLVRSFLADLTAAPGAERAQQRWRGRWTPDPPAP